jgi:hypothetical protein
VSVVSVVSFGPACRQIVGIHDDPPMGGGACGLPYAAACGSCVARSCCDQATACAAAPECATYASCLAACDGDSTCRSTCTLDNVTTYGAHAPEIAALRACLAASCETDCNVRCGAIADYVAPTAASACQACLETRDCPGRRANGVDVAFQEGLLCLRGCRTLDCGAACAKKYPTTGAEASPRSTSALCDKDCAYGQDWSCVGRVAWPTALVDASTLAVTIRDGPAPAPGMRVSVCSRIDCTDPVAQGETDQAGKVTLRVPLHPGAQGPGLSDFLHVVPPPGETATSPAVPIVAYWGFPLSEAAYAFSPTFVRRDFLAQLIALIGQPQAPGHGHVYVNVSDCLFTPAANVVVSIEGDSNTRRVYFDGTTPNVKANKTSASGSVAFTNVPVGFQQITAMPDGLGHASSTMTVYVADGELTSVALVPTPSSP